MAMKRKWEYKPESWKHMSKRNDYGCLVMIVFLGCLLAISACCVSCSKDEAKNQVQDNIELMSDNNLSFDNTTNSFEFSFITNTNWNIQKKDNDNWFSIYPSFGNSGENKVVIKVEKNYLEDSRTSFFTIIAGMVTEKINITQQKDIDIIPLKERYILESNESSFNLEIKANVDYTVKINATWLTVSDSKSQLDNSHTVFVQANTSSDERTAEILISNDEHNIRKVVIVQQLAGIPKNNQLWYSSINGRIVPSETRGFNVGIKSNEFDNNTGRGIITFDGELTTIGNWAFDRNPYLGKIWMPSSITKIGDYAFNDCFRLNDIVLSSYVTDIGQGAFKGCALQNLDFPFVANIGESAFEKCQSLECVKLSNQTSCIRRYTFKDCNNLKKIELGNNIKYIGYQSFYGCSSLLNIELPSSLDSIGQYAFSECNKLTTVDIPNSVDKFGGAIFQNCTSLKYISSKYASYDNRCLIKDGVLLSVALSGLDKYTLPNETLVIPEKIFYNSSCIKELTIPYSVNRIEKSAFEGCTSNLVVCCNIQDCIWDTGFYRGKFAKVKITGMVSRIAGSAFKECKKLEYVEIDEGVLAIGANAFSGCTNIKSISLPNSINNIEPRAFDNCTGELIINCNIPNAKDISSCPIYWSDFSCIIVGEYVEFLGDYVFNNNWRKKKLKSISLGKNIKRLGKSAFSTCSNLESLTVYSNEPPVIDTNCFSGIPESCVLYVPAGSIDNFSEWKEYFGSIIEME